MLCGCLVGHISYQYDWLNKEYDFGRIAANNTQSQDFINGKYAHFLDKAGVFKDYAPIREALGCETIKAAVLIQMSSSVNAFDEKILLVETEDGYYVYDISNTAHLPEGEEKLGLTLEEYISDRSEYEEQPSDRGSFALLGDTNPFLVALACLSFLTQGKLLIYMIIGVVVVCGMILLIPRMCKGKKNKRTN